MGQALAVHGFSSWCGWVLQTYFEVPASRTETVA